MSKSDDMRRMREQLHAQLEPAAATGAKVPARPPVSAAAAPSGEVQGRCAGCGKVRALANGLIAVHQKGLGKICPGSRKEPA